MDDDDGETETQQQTPESGQQQTQQGSEQQTQQQTQESPFFVAATEDEYKAKVGAEQTQARVGLAKKYGFDTLEAFDSAIKNYKQLEDSQKTDAQRLKDQNESLTSTNQQYKERLDAIALEGEISRQIEAVGLNPERLDAINRLRPKNDGEIDAEGNANANLIKASLESVLNDFPEFKKAPTTVGTQSGNPAQAAAQTTTIDERIAEAQKTNDFAKIIELQMMKLQLPS